MSKKKKQQTYVTIPDSADMAALHQRSNVPVKTLCTMFPMYSQRSIYRHAKRKLGQTIEDKRKHNPGRPTKLTASDRRAILQAVNLRRTEGYNFTIKRIKVEAGLVGVVSNRTIQRVLKANGFRYRQSRKKGMMSAQDMKKRVLFWVLIFGQKVYPITYTARDFNTRPTHMTEREHERLEHGEQPPKGSNSPQKARRKGNQWLILRVLLHTIVVL